MTRLCRILCVSSLLFAAFTAPARADLALVDKPSGLKFLFYQEGAVVYGAMCIPTPYPDHDACKHPRQAPAEAFFRRLALKFGAKIAAQDALSSQSWVALQRVDARLFQLVQTSPAADAGALSAADVDAKAVDLRKIELELAGLRDQIARLEQALVTTPGDGEAFAMLSAQREALVNASRRQSAAQDALMALRKAYVTQRALTGDAAFNDLVAMRERYSADYLRAQRGVAEAQDEMVCGVHAARRIAETGFIWTTVCNGAFDEYVFETFNSSIPVSAVRSLKAGRYVTTDDGELPKTIRLADVDADDEGFMASFTVYQTSGGELDGHYTCGSDGSCRRVVYIGEDYEIRPVDHETFVFQTAGRPKQTFRWSP